MMKRKQTREGFRAQRDDFSNSTTNQNKANQETHQARGSFLKSLFAALSKKADTSDSTLQFNVEQLEQRQMLSTVSLYETEQTTINATLTDATAASEYTVQVDLGDGSSPFSHTDFTVTQNGPTNSVAVENIPIVFADDGDYQVSIQLVVDGIVVDEEIVDADVANVAPEITVGGVGSDYSVGAPYYLQLVSNDPGDDQISEWLIDWGDGNIETVDGTSEWVGHTYIHQGDYAITVTATDEDGTYNPVSVTVDSSFGDQGQLSDAIAAEQTIAATAVDDDGSLLVATTPSDTAIDDAAKKFTLTRYDASGSEDYTFGLFGTVEFSLPQPEGIVVDSVEVSSLAVQPDGKIVVAGEISIDGDAQFAVLRFNADGSLDSLFGDSESLLGAGIVLVPVSENADAASLVTFSGQSIYVAGQTNDPLTSTDKLAVAKLNLDGTLDETFGTAGIATVTLSTIAGTLDASANEMLVMSDGNVAIAAAGTSQSDQQLALVKLNPLGQLDTSFGGSGTVFVNSASSLDPLDLVEAANGGLNVAAQSTQADGTVNAAILQYDANGFEDITFGNNGTLEIAAAGLAIGSVKTLSRQDDGTWLVAGTLNNSGTFAESNKAFAQRLLADGSLDTTFGDGGTMVFGQTGSLTDAYVSLEGDVLVVSELAAVGEEPAKTVQQQLTGSNQIAVQAKLDGSTLFDLPAPVSGNIGELVAGAEVFGGAIWRPDLDDGTNSWGSSGYASASDSDWVNYQIEGDIAHAEVSENETAIMVSSGSTGIGYVLYSQETLGTRFGLADRADNHLVAVRNNGGWQYNDGTQWIAFTPVSDPALGEDLLIAEMNFDTGEVTQLDAESADIAGIAAGPLATNLEITASAGAGSPSYLVDGDSVWVGEASSLGNPTPDGSPVTTTTIEVRPSFNGKSLVYVRNTMTDREVGQGDDGAGNGGIIEKVLTRVTTIIVETDNQALIDDIEENGLTSSGAFQNYYMSTAEHLFEYIQLRPNRRVAISNYKFNADFNWEGSDSVTFSTPTGTVSNTVDYDTNGSIDLAGLYKVYGNIDFDTGDIVYLGQGVGSSKIKFHSGNSGDSLFTSDELTITSDGSTNFNHSSSAAYVSIAGGSGSAQSGDESPTYVAPPTDLPDWMDDSLSDVDLDDLLTGGDIPGGIDDDPTIDPGTGDDPTTGNDPDLPASIQGVVWSDLDQNGLRDISTELGIADVEVLLWRDLDQDGVGDALVGKTQSGADGQYEFQDLEPGSFYVVQFQPPEGDSFTELSADNQAKRTGLTDWVTVYSGAPTLVDAGVIEGPENYDFSNGISFGAGGVRLDGLPADQKDGSASGGSDDWFGNGQWHSYGRHALGSDSTTFSSNSNLSYDFNRTDPFTSAVESSSGATSANSDFDSFGLWTAVFAANTNSDGGVNSATNDHGFTIDSAGSDSTFTGESFAENLSQLGEYRSYDSDFSGSSDFSSDSRTFNYTSLNIETTADETADAFIDGKILSDTDSFGYDANDNYDSSLTLRYGRSVLTPETPSEGDGTTSGSSGDGTSGTAGDGSTGGTGDGSTGGTGDGSTGGSTGGTGDGSTGGSTGGTGDGSSGTTGDDGSGTGDGSDGTDSGDSSSESTEPPTPLIYVENTSAIEFLKGLSIDNEAEAQALAGADGTVELETDLDAQAAEMPIGYADQSVLYTVFKIENGYQSYSDDNQGGGGNLSEINFEGDTGETKLRSAHDSDIVSTLANQNGFSVRTISTTGDYANNDGIQRDDYQAVFYSGNGTGSNSSSADVSVVVPKEGVDENGEPVESPMTNPYLDGFLEGGSSFNLENGKTTSVSRNVINGRDYEGTESDDNYDLFDWQQISTLIEVDTITGSGSSSSFRFDHEQGKSDSQQDSDSNFGSTIDGAGRTYSLAHRRTKTTTIPDSTAGVTGSGELLEAGGYTIDSNLANQVETTDVLLEQTTPITTDGSVSRDWLSSFAGSLVDNTVYDPTNTGTGDGNGGTGGSGSGDPTEGDGTETPQYIVDIDDLTSTNSGSGTLDSDSSYGITTNSPSYSLTYDTELTSNYQNGGHIKEKLDYAVESINNAPSTNVSTVDNVTNDMNFLADGLHSTSSGNKTVTTVESGEKYNPTEIRNHIELNDAEGTTYSKTSTIAPQGFYVSYDNTIERKFEYDDFGSISSIVEADPPEGDTSESTEPTYEFSKIGTGKLTRTTTATGDESYNRNVNTVEIEATPEGGGSRTDNLNLSFSKPENSWNLVDKTILQFTEGENSTDPKGSGILSHEISGTRNSGGTVSTSGSHNYHYDRLIGDVTEVIDQDGSYTSTVQLSSLGNRSGTITATYDPDGSLVSATGVQSATVNRSATSLPGVVDTANIRKVTTEVSTGRVTEFESVKDVIQHDDYTSTLESTRTAGVETDADGKTTYAPTVANVFNNIQSGTRQVTTDDITTTTINGGTPVVEDPAAVTNPEAYALSSDTEGFYAEQYGTLGYIGIINESGGSTGGDGSSGPGDDAGGSTGDGGTGDGTSGNYSSGGEGDGSGDGDQEGENGQQGVSKTAFDIVKASSKGIQVLRAPGEDADPHGTYNATLKGAISQDDDFSYAAFLSGFKKGFVDNGIQRDYQLASEIINSENWENAAEKARMFMFVLEIFYEQYRTNPDFRERLHNDIGESIDASVTFAGDAVAILQAIGTNNINGLNGRQIQMLVTAQELTELIKNELVKALGEVDGETLGQIVGLIVYEAMVGAAIGAAAVGTAGAASSALVARTPMILNKLRRLADNPALRPIVTKLIKKIDDGLFENFAKRFKKNRDLGDGDVLDGEIPDEIIAPKSGGRLGRHADLPMDLRGAGLVNGSSRFAKLEKFIADRYGAKISWTDDVSFGMIDELTGTVKLNPATATFDVVAHELSHVRFAQAMGKWGTGKSLSNFEINLMEAIGYWGSYRKGVSSGLSHTDALHNSWFGPSFAQSAIQGLKSGSPEALASLQRAINMFGREYVERALRFGGLGISPRKSIPGF